MRLAPFVVLAGALYGQTKPQPKDRADDSYAVYSAILRKPTLDHRNGNRQYLIEGRTRVDDSKLRGCVHVPAEYAGKLEEVLAEYAHYKDERFQLERKFTVDRPYLLLNDAEAKQVQRYRVSPTIVQGEEPEKFRGAIDVLSFSSVYFDRGRTMAVVRTGAFCGGLCGIWVWRVLIKQEGDWQDKPWGDCVTEARLEPYGLGVPKKDTLSTLASTATSKKPTIISSQLCSPHLTSALGSGLRGLLAELSK